MPAPRSGFTPVLPLLVLGFFSGACDGEAPDIAAPGTAILASQGQAEGVAASAAASPPTTADLFATPAAAMVALRSRHTASLLTNGLVLAAGGTDGSTPLDSAELFDPAVGAWTTTGAMAQAREQHAAVVLATGQVLVTGGLGASGALTGVELYDPQTAQWTAGAPMGQARARHTITRLSSGEVLVLGGSDGAASLASGELYDPVADAWTAIAPLHQARARHTTALLPDGRVLVVGGADDLGGSLATTEILGAKGTWSSGAPLAAARRRHTMTPLADGSLLVAGGVGAAGILASAERYAPLTNLWTSAGAMSAARADHTALVIPLGHVVVAGGQGASGALATAEAYEPAPRPDKYSPGHTVNPWFAAGSMSSPRSEHTATLLGSGETVHAGGAALPSSELFDDTPGALGTACAHAGQCASGICSDSVCCDSGCDGECVACDSTGTCAPRDGSCFSYAISSSAGPGGNCSNGGCLTGSHPQNYCTSANGDLTCGGAMWTSLGVGCVGVSVPNGFLPVTQGCWWPSPASALCNCIAGNLAPIAQADKLGQYCTTTAECGADTCVDGFCAPACAGVPCWSLEGHFTVARLEHTATPLPDGKILFAGGRDIVFTNYSPWNVFLRNGDVFNPVTNTWTASTMAATHYGHTATLLPGGQVIILGGGTEGVRGVYYVDLPTTRGERYDPASGAWAPTGPLLAARKYHTSTLLPGGQLLVVGGVGASAGVLDPLLSAAELYDPATGTSTLAAPMPTPRSHHTATLLPSGRVLVIGGTSSTEVDLYEPSNDTWSLAAPLPAPRSLHTATTLANGKILVTGGDLGQPGASAILYDPANDTWTPAASMGAARAGHAATIVGNGDVIVAGGGAGAERYDPLTDTWSPFGAMLSPSRHGNTTTLLPDGRLLVGFGLLTKDSIWATANIEMTWTTPPPLGQPCSTSASCQGAACVDGVCCNTGCDAGSCDACSVALGATADGVCTTFAGATCDDGNGCTTGDTCQAGGCTGTPADGLACDDGKACTSGDTCQAGVCGGAPVVCAAPDLCHTAGSCNAQTGQCSAAIPRSCPGADSCNDTTCDPATGTCTGPLAPVPDGVSCNDGDECTLGDKCQAGVCTPTWPFLCQPPDACHDIGACVAPAGHCAYPTLPDGTPCPGGTCLAGACTWSGSSSVSSGNSASASSSAGVGGGTATSTTAGAGGSASTSTTAGAGGSASTSSTTGAGGSAVASSSSSGSTAAGSGGMSASVTAGAGGDSSSTTGAVATAAATSSGTGGAASSTVTSSSSGAFGSSSSASSGCSLGPDRAPASRAHWLGLGLLALAARRRRSRRETILPHTP